MQVQIDFLFCESYHFLHFLRGKKTKLYINFRTKLFAPFSHILGFCMLFTLYFWMHSPLLLLRIFLEAHGPFREIYCSRGNANRVPRAEMQLQFCNVERHRAWRKKIWFQPITIAGYGMSYRICRIYNCLKYIWRKFKIGNFFL